MTWCSASPAPCSRPPTSASSWTRSTARSRSKNLRIILDKNTEDAKQSLRKQGEKFANESELEHYTRFRITESGVSPISHPGMAKGNYLASGIEHGADRIRARDERVGQVVAEVEPEAVDEDRLRRGNHAETRGAGQLPGIGQSEVLDPVFEAVRMLAERLVDVEHLLDGDVADGVRRNPPAGVVRLAAERQQFVAIERGDVRGTAEPARRDLQPVRNERADRSGFAGVDLDLQAHRLHRQPRKMRRQVQECHRLVTLKECSMQPVTIPSIRLARRLARVSARLVLHTTMGVSLIAVPAANADWDPAEEARYQAAQKKARADAVRAAAEAKRQREQALREQLASARFNENRARVDAMDEKALTALYQRREKEEQSVAAKQRNEANAQVKAFLDQMTPAQRAQYEKMSGKKIDDVRKDLGSSGK